VSQVGQSKRGRQLGRLEENQRKTIWALNVNQAEMKK
jgi:hypothetical protein